ncbi:hypothetical protein SP19_153 [Salmonella phage 19]|nr:hypothetical protein SP19_153 [Salmonella phage 19]
MADEFRSMSPQDFSDLYDPVADDRHRLREGELVQAKNVVMGDKVRDFRRAF